jgi:hypothetical protein
VTAAAALLAGESLPRPAVAATTFDGTSSRSMAMHVHSSFSEQTGSMEAQLLQARSNAVDVLWWTDHDHRMSALNYRKVVHFTSLTGEVTDGAPWSWQRRTTGSLTGSSVGRISSTGSPNDPIPGSSLSLAAESTSGSVGVLGFYAETHEAGWNERTNLHGQTWSIDVLPVHVGPDGYLELLITSSYHPARGGRAAGVYSLSYRFGGSGAPGSRTAIGTLGVVTLAAAPGQWRTATINPSRDIAALWPDMDERDFASAGITLNAVSHGGLVNGYFDYLRFSRRYISGDIPLQTQRSVSAGLAPAFPSVTQRHGLEMGPFLPHINWFGGAVSLPSYQAVTQANYAAYMRQQVGTVHAAGGLASYNHPFGVTAGSLFPQAQQDALVSQVAATLLNNNVLDTDIIEVGYPQRGGVDLSHHAGLWDVLSRNARFLTGNGVNDDHAGTFWLGKINNWITSAWASSTSEVDLLGALAGGRAWTGTLKMDTSLDLLVDGVCPMGSVSTSARSSRQLRVMATQLPPGGRVQVLRGEVDFAGAAALSPNTVTVRSYSDTEFTSGSVTLPIDTTTACFMRVAVTDQSGAVTALSNPVWSLREAPPGGIPPARAA